MTADEREKELLQVVPTLGCLGEIEGFTGQLERQGEKAPASLNKALSDRIAYLTRKGLTGR